jgi:hypothetical protein
MNSGPYSAGAGLRVGRRIPGERGLVGGEGLGGHALPVAELGDVLTCGTPEPAAEVFIGQQPVDRGAQRPGIARRDEKAGLAVLDEVAKPTHGARHDRSPVRHRLGAGDAESLDARGEDGDRCSGVERLELGTRDKAKRGGNE